MIRRIWEVVRASRWGRRSVVLAIVLFVPGALTMGVCGGLLIMARSAMVQSPAYERARLVAARRFHRHCRDGGRAA